MQQREGKMTIPFPADIKRALERLAAAEHRSASAQVIKAVEECVLRSGHLKRPEAHAT